MIEKWKDVPGYTGIYKASNLGNIKSIIRNGRNKEVIFSPSNTKDGYLQICLRNNGVSKSIKAHRVIALSWINNPHNKPHVNHKNGNKKDNRVANLEWATISENIKHSFKILGRKSSMYAKFGVNHHSSTPIICINTNEKYGSISEAARATGLSSNGIGDVCKGKRNQIYGLKFKYA